ncbi:hypothetical protein H0194_05190 [Corynebacterium incognita]|uniref:Uncharacterized protein n=1 Tax=Corynebacterium incognita TaxID=2754725 RepID=A0A7G7CRZ3_9CORY|nr:hypothetical protein [Corynebacterium incognita]QNE90359.1 hypothetical protein H0194_05190 [Corynebacterium incognita]
MAAMTFKLIRAHLSQLRWMWLLLGYVLLVAYAMTAANQFFVEGNISIGLAVWTATMLFICIMMFSPSAINARAFGLRRTVFLKAALVVSVVVLLPVLAMAVFNGGLVPSGGGWLIIGLTLLLTALWACLSYWQVPTARADENKLSSFLAIGDVEVLPFGPLAVRLLVYPQILWSAVFAAVVVIVTELTPVDSPLGASYAVLFIAMGASGVLTISRTLATWQAFGKTRREWMLVTLLTGPAIAAVFAALLEVTLFPEYGGHITLLSVITAVMFVGLSGLSVWVTFAAMFAVALPLSMAIGFVDGAAISTPIFIAYGILAALTLIVFFATAGRGVRPAKQLSTNGLRSSNNARR